MSRRFLYALIMFLLPSLAVANYPFPHTYFGHKILFQKSGFDSVLTIDGKPFLKNSILSLSEVATVSGVGILIGYSSGGGNICDGAPFVVSFSHGKTPRIDGPIDSCASVSYLIREKSIEFSTASLASKPGESWIWTFDEGFSQTKSVQAQLREDSWWQRLRERSVTHPGEALEFRESRTHLEKMLGSRSAEYFPIVGGTGSAKFEGDVFVGSTCQPHSCGTVEALLVADIRARSFYIAWLNNGIRSSLPGLDKWPSTARRAYTNWSR